MANLNITNFPDSLYETLQKLAEQENRSVEDIVIRLLEKATGRLQGRIDRQER